jgi:hypothetical protein
VALDPVTDQFSQFLRLAFLRSPNFLAGVSGWTINQDGSAEFNNLTIRGTFFGTDFVISALGVFFYSGVPALGNLIISITPAAGADDGQGNAFLAGVSVYNNPSKFFAELTNGGLQVGSLAGLSLVTQAALFTMAQDALAAGTAPSAQIISPEASSLPSIITLLGGSQNGVRPAQVVITSPSSPPATKAMLEVQGGVNGGLSVTGGIAADSEAISGAGGALLKVTETGGAPASPPTQLLAQTAADRVLGIRVTGDAAFRLRVDSNGRHDWGNGTVTDTTLYRASANLLAVDPIAANIAGAAETWHSLGALGAHYTVTLGRYKLTPEGELELDINVVGDGLQATSVSFANTLPAAYRPATQHDTLPMGTTRQVTAGDIWPRLTVTTAGAVTVTNQGTANTFAFAGRIPLD